MFVSQLVARDDHVGIFRELFERLGDDGHGGIGMLTESICIMGAVCCVRHILDHPPASLVAELDSVLYRSIRIASDCGNAKMLRELLPRFDGADEERKRSCLRAGLDSAARKDNVEVADVLIRHAPRWMDKLSAQDVREAADTAAERGSVRVLSLLIRDVGVDMPKTALRGAISNGQTAAVTCLLDHGAEASIHEMHAAIHNGRVDLLRLLHRNWLETATEHDRANKLCAETVTRHSCDVECLRFVLDNGGDMSAFAIVLAARHGSVECIQLLRERGCPWSEAASTEAFLWRKLDCLLYMVRNGCPASNDAIQAADAYGVQRM